MAAAAADGSTNPDEGAEKALDSFVLIRTVAGFILFIISSALKETAAIAILSFLIVAFVASYLLSLLGMRKTSSGTSAPAAAGTSSEQLLLASAEDKLDIKPAEPIVAAPQPAEPAKEVAAPAAIIEPAGVQIEVAKPPSPEETAPEKLD